MKKVFENGHIVVNVNLYACKKPELLIHNLQLKKTTTTHEHIKRSTTFADIYKDIYKCVFCKNHIKNAKF